MQRSSPNPDPRYHVQNIEKMLGDLITHLRDDVGKVDEPKAQALFETGAEVLQGLRTAFVHYQQDREPGMRR
jgi:hypothetical protein